MSNPRFILDYLNNNQPFNFDGKERHSSLMAALRECRLHNKRNMETGIYDETLENGYPGHWLGIIGYFTILDQLGSCFKNVSGINKGVKENSIKYVLTNFGFDLLNSDLTQIDALVALRNSFTHDFNLLNVPENRNRNAHRFNVYWDITKHQIVELPSIPWDGELASRATSNNVTKINVLRFADLVEEIVNRIRIGISNGTIVCQIDPQELIQRYTFIVS